MKRIQSLQIGLVKLGLRDSIGVTFKDSERSERSATVDDDKIKALLVEANSHNAANYRNTRNVTI